MYLTEEDYLKQGIAAVQRGDLDCGARLLAAVVRRNSVNAHAWFWLAQAVRLEMEKRYCLQMVLELEPSLLDNLAGLCLTIGPARRPAVCNEQTGPLSTVPASASEHSIHDMPYHTHPQPDVLRDINSLATALASHPEAWGRWIGYGERLREEVSQSC